MLSAQPLITPRSVLFYAILRVREKLLPAVRSPDPTGTDRLVLYRYVGTVDWCPLIMSRKITRSCT
jgi:hypothetical protein